MLRHAISWSLILIPFASRRGSSTQPTISPLVVVVAAIGSTTAAWLMSGRHPPPATGMMRDSSSVRLIGSVGKGVSTGGWGGLPADFLPEAAALASRAGNGPELLELGKE